MDNQEKSEEVKQAILKIEMTYLLINKAKSAYEKIFKDRSEINKALDQETGFHQKKALQLARIMHQYLPIIIKNKKIIGADWGGDNKVLDRINKMLQNINWWK